MEKYNIEDISYRHLPFKDQLGVRLFIDQVKQMSLEQTKYLLVEYEVHNRYRTQAYNDLLAKKWGLPTYKPL